MKKNSRFRYYLSLKLLLLILFLINACRSDSGASKNGSRLDKQNTNISLSGAFALYPMMVKWAEEFKKLNPNVQIDISAGGAGKGMADVLSGMVDLAMFSREVSLQEEQNGAWKIAVAKDAVFPTINAKNPNIDTILKRGLTNDQFAQLFTGENQKSWDQFKGYSVTEKINVYTRSDACGAAAMWAKFFAKEQEDLKGTGVFGDPGMADAVKRDIHGVGYNNLIYIYDLKSKKTIEGLQIIPIDLNNNGTIDPEEKIYETMNSAMAAIREKVYPSPPSRNLYLISKGEPTNLAVLEFLRYILIDGQNLLTEAGYVQLEASTLNNGKAKLKVQ